MKNQKSALLLSLCWLIGWIAVSSFSPAVKQSPDHPSHRSELSVIGTPDINCWNSGQSPEVPAFRADLGSPALIGPIIHLEFIPSVSQYYSPSFFTKSRSLFDVLITFFYFFHTW
jgi:hypothetical protein